MGARRLRDPLLYLAVAGAAMVILSILLPRLQAEAGEPRLPDLVAEAVGLINTSDQWLSVLVASPGSAGKLGVDPAEAWKLSSVLYEKASRLQASGSKLGIRLGVALESYAYLVNSTGSLASSQGEVSEGVEAASGVASLLAECRLEEALAAGRESEKAIGAAVAALDRAVGEASRASIASLLSEAHRGLAESYTGKLLALKKALEAIEGLLAVVGEEPELVEKAICRGDPAAAAALASRLGFQDAGQLASTLAALSPELASKLYRAALPAAAPAARPGSAAGGASGVVAGNDTGGGAGYREPESDD